MLECDDKGNNPLMQFGNHGATLLNTRNLRRSGLAANFLAPVVISELSSDHQWLCLEQECRFTLWGALPTFAFGASPLGLARGHRVMPQARHRCRA